MSRQPETKLGELYEMLSYGRPHGSDIEQEFVRKYVQSIPGIGFDTFGNGIVQIGNAPVMWSCHTDTVHHKQGMQEVEVFKHKGRPEFMMLGKKYQKRGNCLGADDGAGVWLARRMIEHRISGLYVFHAAEELGGKGSQHLAKTTPDLFKHCKFAVAFDRKGTGDVITHQMGERTCSDQFALTLANQLGGDFVPDDTGVFTDTLSYADMIPECTNISVGYDSAHSHTESLDLVHILQVRDALLTLDVSQWRATRDPTEVDPFDDLLDLHRPVSQLRRKHKPLYPEGNPWKAANDWAEAHDRRALTEYDEDALDELCVLHPDVAARLIRRLGGAAADMVELLDHEGYALN
jgi:hypothetical protein